MKAFTWTNSMTEKQLHEAIVGEATVAGWRHFHPFDMRRSDTGWPDLFLVHPESGRRLAIEVKKADGVVSAKQKEWLADLALCGIPAVVIRPQDRDYVRELLR